MKKTLKIIGIIIGSLILITGLVSGIFILKTHRDQRNYQIADEVIDTVLSDEKYKEKDIYARRDEISQLLSSLKEQNFIYDTRYNANTMMYEFTYANGIWGGISLGSLSSYQFDVGADTDLKPESLNVQNALSTDDIRGLSKRKLETNEKINAYLAYGVGPEFDIFFKHTAENWGSQYVDLKIDGNYTVDKLKHIEKKDVYLFLMHGSEYNNQSVLVIQEDDHLFQYWKDLKRHDIAKVKIDGKNYYFIFPSFFKQYYKSGEFKDSLLIVYACKFFGCDCKDDKVNTSYADMFIKDLGVDTVLGFKNTVNAYYASNIVDCVMNEMLEGRSSIASALNIATKRYGDNEGYENVEEDDDYCAFPVLRGDIQKTFIVNVKETDNVTTEPEIGTEEKTTTESKANAEKKNKTESRETQTTETSTRKAGKTTEKENEKGGASEWKGYMKKEDAEAIYEGVICSYIEHWKQYLEDGDINLLGNDYKYEISDLTPGGYNIFLIDGGFSDTGFKVEDMDGDGIYELIIASKNSSLIFDLYTLVDERPKLLLSSWDRCSVLYCGDYFYRDGSSGAAYHSVERYTLKDGEMQLIDDVYSEPTEENYEASIYYYLTEPAYEDGNREEISPDQYDSYIEKWNEKNEIVNDLMSFDAYIKDSGLTSYMACKAVEKYCREQNPSLNDMDPNEHVFYWNIEGETNSEYTILFRSYTGSMSYFYIDVNTGDVTLVEEPPSDSIDDVQTYENAFNIWDYIL